jgi:alanyl-tRNA synthetase
MGTLDKLAVTNVTIREADGAILHWISSELWSDEVAGTIEWNRRFDHMQQHSGQHILSQAFLRVANVETVSFHLSAKTVTIDLHTVQIQPEQVEQAELLANRIVWENRPINVRYVTAVEAQALPLRKIPPSQEGRLRLIEVADFDLSACGGTHVAQTGAVGLIKIVKLERNGEQLRVEFRCGQRALLDYRMKNSIIGRLTNLLTTGMPELVESVDKMQEEIKESRRTAKQQQTALVRLEAESMLARANVVQKTRIVSRVFTDEDSNQVQLRALASYLAKEPNVVALLGLAGEKSLLIFARAEDAPGNMSELIKSALPVLGSASGGGKPEMAQGGGPTATADRVQQALEKAERLLIGQI